MQVGRQKQVEAKGYDEKRKRGSGTGIGNVHTYVQSVCPGPARLPACSMTACLALPLPSCSKKAASSKTARAGLLGLWMTCHVGQDCTGVCDVAAAGGGVLFTTVHVLGRGVESSDGIFCQYYPVVVSWRGSKHVRGSVDSTGVITAAGASHGAIRKDSELLA
ncbi:hypothetical protein B0T17DRAFT_511382 [Bombardia bombarda]|uniref:Uncharacterized protein n=1 Tax=Bombardia bombarda TaxID=252184 RepID=A0AA39U6Q6_9PEZI|nr:hypothetical protein B0T17DRAFT_511382 [Bombardia bombarda]